MGNKRKKILILGKGPTQALDDTTLTAEAQYAIYSPRSNGKFCLRRHYNWSKSFLFVDAAKIYQLKTKCSDIKKYPLWLGDISGDFPANNMKKQD